MRDAARRHNVLQRSLLSSKRGIVAQHIWFRISE